MFFFVLKTFSIFSGWHSESWHESVNFAHVCCARTWRVLPSDSQQSRSGHVTVTARYGLFHIFLPHYTYYYSFQPCICIMMWCCSPKEGFSSPTVKQTICWGAPLFFIYFLFISLTLSCTMYYLFHSSVLQMVSGLRTNQGSANYQEGNGFLNNVCRRRNWWRVAERPRRRGQTMPARRGRKSHCSTWDKHNFILMNNWESLELGWDNCARICVTVMLGWVPGARSWCLRRDQAGLSWRVTGKRAQIYFLMNFSNPT